MEHDRSTIPSIVRLLNDLDSDPRMKVVPLDRVVLDRSVNLTAVSEMHDRLIVATALEIAADGDAVPILTRDVNIRESGLVPVVW